MQPFRNSKRSRLFCEEDDRQINTRSPKRNQKVAMVPQVPTCMQIFLPKRGTSLSVLKIRIHLLFKLHYQFMNILVRKAVARSKPQVRTDLYFSSSQLGSSLCLWEYLFFLILDISIQSSKGFQPSCPSCFHKQSCPVVCINLFSFS